MGKGKRGSTGNATDYAAAEAAALEAAAEAALDEYWGDYDEDDEDDDGRDYPTSIRVRANIEWSGEQRGIRDTTLINLDLREFVQAIQRRGQLGAGRALASYRAKGWHAQLRQLERTRKGRDAAAAAGLSPSARTLQGWLGGNEPSKENVARIDQAYANVRDAPLRAAERANTRVTDALNRALRNSDYGTEIRLYEIQEFEFLD